MQSYQFLNSKAINIQITGFGTSLLHHIANRIYMATQE